MLNLRDSRRLTSLVLISLVSVACGDSTTTPTPARDATVDTAANDASKGTDATSNDGSTQTALSDGQVVGVLMASDMGEIAQGQFAMSQGADAQVRAFGQTMVTMHTEASARLTALRMRLGIAPAESSLSAMLTADATATRDRLAGLSGVAFDRAYVAAQVTQHARVLDIIDSALIPNAMNAELRASLMTEVRPMVAMHLEQARALQATVGSP